MHVYWVDAYDHADDWFVAAESMETAAQFFADELGYDVEDDEVCAKEICMIPEKLNVKYYDFLDNEQIIACGGEFLEFHDEDLLEHIPEEFLRMVAGETRIVRFDGEVYMEGNVMRLALQMQGKLNNSIN
jgi:hypothetical protein